MSARPRVLIADFLDETGVESPVLAEHAELVLGLAHDEADLAAHLPHADALILYHDIARLSEASFALAPRLKAVVRAGVGYNNVELAAAGERGIVVCNVPDYGTEEVADHAILLLLAVARKLLPCHVGMKCGEWDYRLAAPTPRLRGKTLGIVGCGRIGTATVLRAKAFGLDIVFFDPLLPPGVDKALGIRRADSLAGLMEQSHFVSVHCYLDRTTHHLIDAAALARMPAGGILVNTARGPIVDQEALIVALESGHLAGAGLDVFEREPLDDTRLRDHPGVVMTPHSAFYSEEGFVELRRKTAEEVARILSGTFPLNPVNLAFLKSPRAKVPLNEKIPG
jgi:phosphoglycerate dehydrogenase-like enzyme